MRRVSLVLLALLLTATAVAAGPAEAKRKPTCAKLIKREGGKVRGKAGGFVVYQRRSFVSWCLTKTRKLGSLGSFDYDGVKVTKVVASRKGGCVAVLGTGGADSRPQFLFANKRNPDTATGNTIGGDAGAAAVGSMAIADNCGFAWGQTVDGTSTIDASLAGVASTVATVSGSAATTEVTAKASGKGLVVGWNDGGPKTATVSG